MIGILIITDAPPPSGTSPSEVTSSTDTGSVIGGTLLGVLALVVLVTALLGCLIYYKRRNGRKLNRRYQLLLFMATCTPHAHRDLIYSYVVFLQVKDVHPGIVFALKLCLHT